jgi:hypothetical protein
MHVMHLSQFAFTLKDGSSYHHYIVAAKIDGTGKMKLTLT